MDGHIDIAMSTCLSPAQLQVLNIIRQLWMEHVVWTRSFIISTAHNLPDLDVVTQRLLRNPTDFARILRPLYGDQKAMEFEKLFKDHLLIAADLVNAAKAGDMQKAAEARRKWYANADDIALFLSGLNPYWDRKVWQTMLYEHLKMTENETVLRLTGQYAADIAQFEAIEDQAMKMADYMAYGILKQFNF